MAMFAMATLAATAPIAITVDVGAAHPLHKINPLYSGCHSDSGFTHQVRGYSAQMIFGESFEAPQPNVTEGKASDAWSFALSAGVHGSVATSASTVAPAMHGASSRTITVTSVPAAARGSGPTPTAALLNRGLGNEGFYFEAGKEYEGYFFARCQDAVTLVVRLEDFERGEYPGASPAEWSTDFQCGASPDDWVKVEFDAAKIVHPDAATALWCRNN